MIGAINRQLAEYSNEELHLDFIVSTRLHAFGAKKTAHLLTQALVLSRKMSRILHKAGTHFLGEVNELWSNTQKSNFFCHSISAGQGFLRVSIAG
jgi:hypothetical protein